MTRGRAVPPCRRGASRRRLGAAALVVAAALSTAGLGPLPLDADATAPRAAHAVAATPDVEPRPPYPRSVGLPAAVALVALGGTTAALLRVLRSEPRRGSGYAEAARREHPPVTERP